MGFLKGLFGRSKNPPATASDRCMECGMTGGTHTTWCPSVAAAAPPPAPPPPVDEPRDAAPPV